MEKIKVGSGYDIEKDKLRFSNIGSYNLEGGMCLDFSMYKKTNHMDTLNKFNESLSEEMIRKYIANPVSILCS